MRPLRIVVAGMVAAVPNHGGATWALLQYLLGLRRLGHDVWFIEPMRADDVIPHGAAVENSHNAMYAASVLDAHGFAGRWSLLVGDSGRTAGLDAAALSRVVRSTDVLVNVAGCLTDPALLEPIPVRVYLDLDPCFVQMWHAYDGIDMHFAAHTHFFTVGLRIDTPACPVPTLGLQWQHLLPPVVLEHWPAAPPLSGGAFTTVANWRGYGSIEHEGVFYGQKAHAVRELIELPDRIDTRVQLALAIHPDETSDLELLDRHGWTRVDPARVAGDPASYRRFIQASKAELGLAKSGYVRSRCGWFSDRSACYLASARPVVAHDTGLRGVVPVGEGFLVFDDVASAAEAIGRVSADYEHHCVAARRFAEELLDSDVVLSKLLASVGAA
jgi:hypothetical protein